VTAIGELRIGRGTLGPALSAREPYLLVVPEDLRDEVLSGLAVPPVDVVIASSLEQAELDELFDQVPAVDCVAGVGGGVAIDVAKYGAGRLGVPLVAAPTILSTTAYINPLAVLRDGGRSVMVPAPGPAAVIVDLDVLERAPTRLNVAGLGDILSCHTALFDWNLTAHDVTADQPWDERAARQCRLLVDSIAAHADDFRVMNERALKLLVDMHIEVVDICEGLGHARPESGSEHLLTEAIEELTGRTFLHGPIVGLGIDVMSELQGNDHEVIVALMDEIGLGHSPEANGVTRLELEQALTHLAHPDAPPRFRSVVDDARLDEARIAELVASRSFA
jgi:glycerol dehydrogenase-like iron-containing ADH family enzyme